MKIDNDDNITISKKRYKQLLESERFLYALEAAGVDNWEGYSLACEEDDDDLCPDCGKYDQDCTCEVK